MSFLTTAPSLLRSVQRCFVSILLLPVPVGPPQLADLLAAVYFSSMSTSGWTRYPRNSTAFRGAGEGALVLVRKPEGTWQLSPVGGGALTVDAPDNASMEQVIEVVDLVYPPAGWERLDHNSWQRGDWLCVHGTSGWRVQHPRHSTRQVFRSADRARKWVDLRHDRPGGIKGPRPRGNVRATKTLPDVRVTVEERERFTSLATRLNVTFSELVRRALTAVDEGHLPLA